MTALDLVSLGIALAAAGLASLRWLRVAQREHYLAGSTSRFAWRWWRRTRLDTSAVVLGFACAAATAWLPPLAVVPAAVAALAPRGLGIRGRTSRLHWTRRLTTLAVAAGVLEAVPVVVAGLAGDLTAAVVAAGALTLLAPVVIDVALWVARPIEDAVAGKYVTQATARLQRVRPTIVAVTGSYGKTTTKGYIAHLVGAERDTLASPASFNNRAGLARTVNEYLGPATDVLVAEMGTYGPGEIAALCAWLPPEIAVITAVGPAHLERFKSLERTLDAKAEITEHADVTVLNVDDERLRRLAGVLEGAGKRVVKASGTHPDADVAVLALPDGIELRVAGRRVGMAVTGPSARPTALSNVACAVAVALELRLAAESLLPRLATLPIPPNRLQRYVAEAGYVVLDDTFNSNPAGARLALGRLAEEAPEGRRVLVTPGMVELGSSQFDQNAALAEDAAAVVSELVAVARTNRRALATGATRAVPPVPVVLVDRLDEAVAWVREHLGSGDAVLYENDLPDHFP